MPHLCFVPGCKSGSLKSKKENEKAGTRNLSMFSAPKDNQLFEKWKQIIPTAGRDFSSKDKICELHFEQNCISREYVNLRPDGSLYQIPKERFTLKKGSIPTIFQNLPAYVSAQIRKRKALARSVFSSRNKDGSLENVIDISRQLNDNLDENIDIPSQLNGNVENALINTPSRVFVQIMNRKAPVPSACSYENKHRKSDDSFENVIDISPQLNDNLGENNHIPPQLNGNIENAVINTPPAHVFVQIMKRKAQATSENKPHKPSYEKPCTLRAPSYENKHRKSDDNLENVIDLPPQLNDNLDENIDILPQLNDNLEENIDIPSQLNGDVENAVNNSPPQFSEFFKFSAEVKNISIPNSLWTIACTENFVIFVKWNSKYYSERRVVVCKDLSTKIFLMDIEVSLPFERCTIENISQLLKKVNYLEICKNADSRPSGCLGFLDGRRKVFCSPCAKSRKYKKDVQRRREKRILTTKKKNIMSEVKNVKRRNARLLKKVLDLKIKLEESKHLYSQTKKEILLKAIAHLPAQQQAAIKSCFSASKAKSSSPDEIVEVQEESDSDYVIEEEFSENSSGK